MKLVKKVSSAKSVQSRCLRTKKGWTDAAEPDVFVSMAAGRCPFRLEDLLELALLIDGLRLED